MSKKSLEQNDSDYILDALDVAKDQIENSKVALKYESLIIKPDDPVANINDKIKVSTFITNSLLAMTREYMELKGIMDFYRKSTEKGKKEKIRGGTNPTGFESMLNKQ